MIAAGTHSLLKHLLAALFVIPLMITHAAADEIRVKPETLQFNGEDKQDAQARTCSLMMTIADTSRPEVVNFRVIHALSPQAISFGFGLNVDDTRYQNGRPTGLTKATLTSGDVTLPSFSSQGTMTGGPTPDGGVLKSTLDKDTASKLWHAVLFGNYTLHTVRVSAGAAPRDYVISTPPSRDAIGNYLACSLEIRDIASGAPKSPELYASARKGGPGITEALEVVPAPGSSMPSMIQPLVEQGPFVGKR
jgi:hypothetical protein